MGFECTYVMYYSTLHRLWRECVSILFEHAVVRFEQVVVMVVNLECNTDLSKLEKTTTHIFPYPSPVFCGSGLFIPRGSCLAAT